MHGLDEPAVYRITLVTAAPGNRVASTCLGT